jgi:hypothetical protein
MAATGTTEAAALPYVSWASLTIARVPADSWPTVFASMQALKGHVQEYPGCQKLEAFVHADPDGTVVLHTYTVWDTPEQLEAFLERGYTVERMLQDIAGIPAEPRLLMEKVF